MKLIVKDALVAEIDRQKIGYNTDGKHSVEYNTVRKVLDIIDTLEVIEIGVDLGDPKGDKSALSVIDTQTLEVKEVDFDEEIEKCLKQHSMLAVGRKDFTDIAKHFFELGLKAHRKENKVMRKLQHITFTGIDGKTDLGALWELQQQYPIAEFGVLVAKNWRENGNRYFNPSYLDALESRGLNLSAHLCGSIARAAVRGDFEPFREWATAYPDIFNRCQLNIATSKENPDSFELCEDAFLFDEIILQQRSVDDCDLYLKSNTNEYVTMLLDASGGEGIDTPIRVLKGRKVGYAGGINADNVAEKLTFLMENEMVGDFWIDMETGVRTDDWFDIEKVRRVLEICEPIIRRYEENHV